MIPETVTLTFNPEEANEEIRKVFACNLARTLWLAIRPGHIVSQYFHAGCLHYAGVIKKRLAQEEPLTAEQLLRILSGMTPGYGIIGHGELAFARDLLLLVNGERTIDFKVAVAT